ncbi:MAG TPA: MFS transporter, partial [Sphingobium sp.]|nr:MFS transporter [Sphingobium sp.]
FAVFNGLYWVATVPPTVKLTAQRFGPEKANIVFGWIFAGHQLGAASAALGGGLSRTVWQSYMPAFIGAGILCLIGAGLVLLINRGGRREQFATA